MRRRRQCPRRPRSLGRLGACDARRRRSLNPLSRTPAKEGARRGRGRSLRRCARPFPPHTRPVPPLSFTHRAAMAEETWRHFWSRAAAGGWTRRRDVNASCSQPFAPPFPTQSVICMSLSQRRFGCCSELPTEAAFSSMPIAPRGRHLLHGTQPFQLLATPLSSTHRPTRIRNVATSPQRVCFAVALPQAAESGLSPDDSVKHAR